MDNPCMRKCRIIGLIIVFLVAFAVQWAIIVDDWCYNFFFAKFFSWFKNYIFVLAELYFQFITIFERIVKKDNIILYLFENDLIKCKINANKKVKKFIETYSVLYDPYNYKSYNCNILPVYSQINLQ